MRRKIIDDYSFFANTPFKKGLICLVFLDTLAPTISLNRTKASLNCSTGFMNIKLSFQQDFYGIVYADYDRKINLLLNQK